MGGAVLNLCSKSMIAQIGIAAMIMIHTVRPGVQAIHCRDALCVPAIISFQLRLKD